MFSFPWILTPYNLKKFISFSLKHFMVLIFINLLLFLLIMYQNEPHPYLLADNRHYTFYLWKRILGKQESYFRFGLIPAYCLSAWSFISLLERKDTLLKCLIALCTMLSIVPQKLIEFRYFIPAFVIWRLNLITNSSVCLTIEFIFNILINLLTVYIFLYVTFKWSDTNEVQRFIW